MPEFIITPAQLTSKLAAVNAMIFTLGETGVTSLDPPTNTDAESALGVLDQMDLLLQTKGWSWNREDCFGLGRDEDGNVYLPDQTLHATSFTYSSGSPVRCVQRGTRLYDLTNHTYAFDQDLEADLIVRLEWDDTPQSYRSYLVMFACQQFHASLQERTVLLRVNDGILQQALITLEQAEDEWARTNPSRGPSAQAALGERRRNRQGLI